MSEQALEHEIDTAEQIGGRLGRVILFMQLSWRPLFAYETILECAGMGVIAAHEIWTGDLTTVSAMMSFKDFLIWYFGFKFAMLGVYSAGRTVEKIKGTTS